MATPNDFIHLVQTKGHFELIEKELGPTRVRFLGRVLSTAGMKNSTWPLIAHQLLLMSRGDSPWKVDISRQYFLRELPQGPKMFYAWRLIFQGQELSDNWGHIVDAVRNAPTPSRTEVMEIPIQGGGERNMPKNGKGAATLGSAQVGPGARRL